MVVSYDNSTFNSLGKLHTVFPLWPLWFSFPPTVHKTFLFSISSPTVISCLLMIAIIAFAFPWWLMVLSMFSCMLSHLCVFFGGKKCLFGFYAHFFNWTFFFAIEFCELFVYFGYYPLIRWMLCKYFLPLIK